MNRREFIASVAGIAMIPAATKKEPKPAFTAWLGDRKLSDDHLVVQLVSEIPDYALEYLKGFGSVYLLKGRNGLDIPVCLCPISPQFVMKHGNGFRVQAEQFGSGPWDLPSDDLIEIMRHSDSLLDDYAAGLTTGLKSDFGDHLELKLEETA